MIQLEPVRRADHLSNLLTIIYILDDKNRVSRPPSILRKQAGTKGLGWGWGWDVGGQEEWGAATLSQQPLRCRGVAPGRLLQSPSGSLYCRPVCHKQPPASQATAHKCLCSSLLHTHQSSSTDCLGPAADVHNNTYCGRCLFDDK